MLTYSMGTLARHKVLFFNEKNDTSNMDQIEICTIGCLRNMNSWRSFSPNSIKHSTFQKHYKIEDPPACASLAGFQHRSKWITWLAVVRFKPTPPAWQGVFTNFTVFCLLFQPSPAFKVRIKTRHFGSEENSFKASRTWSHGTKPPWS